MTDPTVGAETGTADVAGWWQDVVAAALVGTERRPAPPLPGWPVAARAGAEPPVALLDAVTLGSTWRTAGVATTRGEVPDPAPDEVLPEAPARALQLLDVVLDQPPGGAALQDVLLEAWLVASAEHGYRLPHDALTRVLAAVRGRTHLRRLLVPVVGERGRWLAGLDPAHRWLSGEAAAVAAEDDDALAERWSHLGTDERVAELARLRGRADRADLARRLVESTWGSDPARVRSEMLRALAVGLGPDDEPLLEQALDDRAAGVRDVATQLLDRLPGSARAQRMGRRLAALVTAAGLLRRTITVADPDDPDPAGVRDGLRPPPKGVSVRGHHRRTIIRAAPLDTWTEVTGLRPDQVFRALPDDETRLLLATAVLHQGQGRTEWVRAAMETVPSAGLVPLLPVAERPAAVAALLGRKGAVGSRAEVLAHLPGPWDDATSDLVVAALQRAQSGPAMAAAMRGVLAARLSPVVADRLRAWAGRDGVIDPHARAIVAVAATISTRQSVHDAFSGDRR